jgi:4-amino-4-deoxy-L-arabinose transferase-like glycosyltransferase
MTAAASGHAIGNFIRQPGFALAVINFCVGLVWMAVILPLDAPDEPGHLQAIMQVRKQHILPEMHLQPAANNAPEMIRPPRDPDTLAYIRNIRQELPVNDHALVIPYKSVQPPLYYVMAGLFAQVAPPEPKTVLYIGRLLSVLLGAATVYFCWLTVRELAPDAPILAAAAAGVTALLPQFCFTNAHAANDSAVNLATTAAFYVWIRGLRRPEFDRRLFGAGAMLGFALLSKLTAIVLVPGLILVILFRMFQAQPNVLGLGKWLRRGVAMIAGATLSVVSICGWWFVRNMFTYGEPSGTEAELHTVAGNLVKADFSKPQTAADLAHYTLENLWGRFGWNDITLPHGIYHLCNTAGLILVCLSVLVGIGAFVVWVTRDRASNVVTWQAAAIFLAIGAALLGGFIEYNAKVAYQPQARYFFLLLVPCALMLTAGLHRLAATRALRLATVGTLLIAFGVLNGSALVALKRAGPAHGGVRHKSHRRHVALA